MKNPLKFFQEVKQEAFKVTWPTGKETVQGTIMVAIMAIIASLFFLLIDQPNSLKSFHLSFSYFFGSCFLEERLNVITNERRYHHLM